MSVQQEEIDEAQAMLSDVPALYPLMIRELGRSNNERDLYKARYECLKKLCGIGKQDRVEDWCALQGWDSVIVEKKCDTVDEAVDFVLKENGK